MEARPITRDDLEAKLREIRGEVDEVAASTKQYALVGAAVAVVAVAGVAYLLGRRKGRRRSTFVEVRRV